MSTILIDFPKIKYRGFIIDDRFPYASLYVEGSRQRLWEGSVNSCKEWVDDFLNWCNK